MLFGHHFAKSVPNTGGEKTIFPPLPNIGGQCPPRPPPVPTSSANFSLMAWIGKHKQFFFEGLKIKRWCVNIGAKMV